MLRFTPSRSNGDENATEACRFLSASTSSAVAFLSCDVERWMYERLIVTAFEGDQKYTCARLQTESTVDTDHLSSVSVTLSAAISFGTQFIRVCRRRPLLCWLHRHRRILTREVLTCAYSINDREAPVSGRREIARCRVAFRNLGQLKHLTT